MSAIGKERVGGLNQADAQCLMLGGTKQAVSYDASAQSTALADTTTLVRLLSSTDCHVVAGSDPTATVAAGARLVANMPEVFGVRPGWKIAAIKAATAGTLEIYEAP